MKKEYMEPVLETLEYRQQEAISVSLPDEGVNEDELEWGL